MTIRTHNRQDRNRIAKKARNQASYWRNRRTEKDGHFSRRTVRERGCEYGVLIERFYQEDEVSHAAG